MSSPAVDSRWDQAIELMLTGTSQKLVAERVGVHRNTIRNWMRDLTFRRELSQRADERAAEVKLRRAVTLTAALDRLARIANQALASAEREPRDRRAQRLMLDWLRIYRKLRKEERLDATMAVHSDGLAGISALSQLLDEASRK